MPSAEALPHLGGLALPAYQGELPDEIELHAVERLPNAFDDTARQDLLKRTPGTQKVRERLNRGRCLPIGISRRGEEAKGERHTYLVVAYDYSADVTVQITLDERREVVEMTDERYQPPPIESEIERAIDLARADARLSARVEGLVASAIPFSGHADEFANRRVLEVLFGCRAERLPRFRAWVDLSRETVLHAGARVFRRSWRASAACRTAFPVGIAVHRHDCALLPQSLPASCRRQLVHGPGRLASSRRGTNP